MTEREGSKQKRDTGKRERQKAPKRDNERKTRREKHGYPRTKRPSRT